ncbi:hypothetical protein GCM10027596_31540 [Nocardioides korecus]
MPRTLETQLVSAGRGDRRAFAAVYDALSPRAYGLALRILKDPNRAEVEVRDAFGEAWRCAGSFEPSNGSADAWLLAIVHRRVVVAARTSARTGAALHAPQDVSMSRPVHRSTAAVCTSTSSTTTGTAPGDMGPAHREAIELAYLDGVSLRDLSRRLDLQLAALAQLLREGLRTIVPTKGPAAGF